MFVEHEKMKNLI